MVKGPGLRSPLVVWDHSPILQGRIVCIIGGGPSLKGFDLTPIRDAGAAAIAVNNSWQLAPWADICHFGDKRWWQWNSEKLLNGYQGTITTSTLDTHNVQHVRLKRFRRSHSTFSNKPGVLYGPDSGTQSVNLAFLLGARRIVLLGIDNQPSLTGETHWHKQHKVPTKVERYKAKFGPAMHAAICGVKAAGGLVVRATNPGLASAPHVPLSQALTPSFWEERGV